MKMIIYNFIGWYCFLLPSWGFSQDRHAYVQEYFQFSYSKGYGNVVESGLYESLENAYAIVASYSESQDDQGLITANVGVFFTKSGVFNICFELNMEYPGIPMDPDNAVEHCFKIRVDECVDINNPDEIIVAGEDYLINTDPDFSYSLYAVGSDGCPNYDHDLWDDLQATGHTNGRVITSLLPPSGTSCDDASDGGCNGLCARTTGGDNPLSAGNYQIRICCVDEETGEEICSVHGIKVCDTSPISGVAVAGDVSQGCVGQLRIFQASPAGDQYNYSWTINNVGIGNATGSTMNVEISEQVQVIGVTVTPKSNGCLAATSATSVMPAGFELDAGLISGDQELCGGDDPSILSENQSATGQGTLHYQWQYSSNGGSSWSDIAGANSSNYYPDNYHELIEDLGVSTISYRREVDDECHNPKPGNTVQIARLPPVIPAVSLAYDKTPVHTEVKNGYTYLYYCYGEEVELTASVTGTQGAEIEWMPNATIAQSLVLPVTQQRYAYAKVTPVEDCGTTVYSERIYLAPYNENLPTVSISTSATSICPGQSVRLTANTTSSPASLVWSTGATTSSIIVSPGSNQKYTVSATFNVASVSQCMTEHTSTASYTVEVGLQPEVTISATPEPVSSSSNSGGYTFRFCEMTPVQLAASAANMTNPSYEWTVVRGSGSGAVTEGAVFSVDGGVDGSIDVELTVYASGECEAAETVLPVHISGGLAEPLEATISVGQTEVCLGQAVELNVQTSAAEADVLWSTGETTPSIEVTPESTTTYTVVVTPISSFGHECYESASIEASTSITVLNEAPDPLVISGTDLTSFSAIWLAYEGASSYELEITDIDHQAPAMYYLTSALTYSFSDLIENTQYQVRYRALNTPCGTTDWSPFTEALTLPPRVSGASIEAILISGGTFELVWAGEPQHILDYEVEVFAEGETRQNHTGILEETYTLENIEDGILHTAVIRQRNATGVSEDSEPIELLTYQVLKNVLIEFCNSALPDINLTVDNLVAGYWYRLYRQEEVDLENWVNVDDYLHTEEKEYHVFEHLTEGVYELRVFEYEGSEQLSLLQKVTIHSTESGCYNIVESVDYGPDNTESAHSKTYYDDAGRLLQSQSRSYSQELLLASESLRDRYGREVLQTLAAPINSREFLYSANFAANEEGESYSYSDFEDATPIQVDNSLKGTLGWYYSDHNTDEPYVAGTAYPYLRQVYDKDHIEVLGMTSAGSSNDLTGKRFRISRRLALGNELVHYAQLAAELGVDDFEESSFVTYSEDAQGVMQLTVTNQDGQVLMTAMAGDWLSFENQVMTNTGDHYFYTTGGAHQVNYSTASGYLFQLKEARAGDLLFHRQLGVVAGSASLENIPLDAGLVYWDPSSDESTGIQFTIDVPVSLGLIAYHFYDRKGRLIASVSPKGVLELLNAEIDEYNELDDLPYTTLYTYDFQDRLVQIEEPDAGITRYRYRRDGSIRFSENAEQGNGTTSERRFSYTSYDALGRPVESGEYIGKDRFAEQDDEAILERTGRNEFDAEERRDWIETYYDLADPDFSEETGLNRVQVYTAGAVSYTRNEQTTTWYSYDELGRVAWVVQQYAGLDKVFTLDYSYDYFGQVTRVAFQEGVTESSGSSEAFYHHYVYDADQRLKEVYLSTDGTSATQVLVATYEYYQHGPLKRIELGNGLQGVDFVYTADGALKSINHPEQAKDPGGDGELSGYGDVFGVLYDYYAGDYQRAGAQMEPLAALSETAFPGQYQGNIRATTWKNSRDNVLQTYAYTYDDRQQLTGAVYDEAAAFDGSSSANRVDNITYDPNGNILSLRRKDAAGTSLHDLAYTYFTGNRLATVSDYASYEYNRIGQLVALVDRADGTPDQYFQYDVTGKLTGIYADAGYTSPVNTYAYDDRGFRILKREVATGAEVWYVRDASGSLMAVYERLPGDVLRQRELPVYGSGRLGVAYKYPGQYKLDYQLADHLGNVRAVVSGYKDFASATMETTDPEHKAWEEAQFENVASTRFIGNNYTGTDALKPSGLNSSRIGVNQVGLAKSLEVTAGDRIAASVYAMYTGSSNGIPTEFGALVASSVGIVAGENPMVVNSFNTAVSGVLGAFTNYNNVPLGYLQILLFDENYTPIALPATAGQQLTSANLDAYGLLKADLDITTDMLPEGEVGYAYVYLANSNKSGNAWIYFDDFTVEQFGLEVVQTSDYYPFGYVMSRMVDSSFVMPPREESFLTFDGVDDYVDAGDVLLDGLTEFTVEAWVKPTELTAGSGFNEEIIVGKVGSNDYNFKLYLNRTSLTYLVDLDGGRYGETITSPMTLGEWNHLAIVYDGDLVSLYVDGVMVDYIGIYYYDSNDPVNDVTGSFVIGGSPYESFFTGDIKEVRVWNYAREEEQIEGAMHDVYTASSIPEGLIGYWRLNEGSGGTVADMASGHTGTLVGDPVWATEVVEDGGSVIARSFGQGYRYGYQGEFSEEDPETGFNHFEARMYDPVIGRWMAVDPARQYASGYVGMGNNPIGGVDPDGRRNVNFDADGNYIGITHDNFFHNLLFGSRGVVQNADGGFGSTFRFADPDADVAQLQSGEVTKLLFISEGEIRGLLAEGGALQDLSFSDAIAYIRAEGVGGGKLDYSYTAIPGRYPGASNDPLRSPSPMLFLVNGTAHNHMNFGNFLFGASGEALGVPLLGLQLGAHGNSLGLFGDHNGYDPQLDSSDDQLSIRLGFYYSRQHGYYHLKY